MFYVRISSYYCSSFQNRRMRHLLLLCLFSLSITLLGAQGTIKGKLMDTASKTPLSLATVTVFQAADTTLITYRLSNPEGEFRVPGIPLNVACRVVISFSGYEAYRKEFTLTNSDVLELGTIAMTPTSISLDEVLVTSERPPVSVRASAAQAAAPSPSTPARGRPSCG